MIIALPNKGRLSEPSIEILREAGIKIDYESRKLIAPTNKEGISVLFARARDIPEYVHKNAAQVGITGIDLVEESGADVEILIKLGFGKARLVIAVPLYSGIETIYDLEGKTIATEFRRITEKFFKERGINVDIIEVAGACEIAPSIGIADAIVDLTSTGTTLKLNGLKVIEEIMKTEAALIANKKELNDFKVQALKTAIQSVINARGMVYLMMNVPEDRLSEIKRITPGLKGPTIMKVEANGMLAVHVVVHESHLFELVEKLKNAGARDILVVPIQRLIF